MKLLQNSRAYTLIELLICVFIPTVWIATAFWIERNLDFWGSYIKGYPIHFPFVLDLILALVAGVNWVVLIISEIVRFFVTH